MASSTGCELNKLHGVLQVAMGWTNSHLHRFIVGGVTYGEPDPEWDPPEIKILNETRHILAELVPNVKGSFIYEYDFGDGWAHHVVLEKSSPPDAEFNHPLCLDGANAAPPEDCGGSPGYAELVEALADPEHEQHLEMKEWAGDQWDPTRFSLKDVNATLKRLKA